MLNTHNEELMQSPMNLAINNDSSSKNGSSEKKSVRVYADKKEKVEMREVNPRAIH